MSVSDVFAEPMPDRDDYLREYLAELVRLEDEGLLPKLDENLQYKVYSIRETGCGAHKSIVLTADAEQFFTVELGFTKVDGVKYIRPVTRPLSKSLKHKMEYLGTIKAKGQYLLAKAVAVMKHFGSYFKFCNNCQDYCNKYVAAIGLERAQSLTDSDKAKIAGIVSAILAFLAIMLRR